jgi:site-specific DNA recombinase
MPRYDQMQRRKAQKELQRRWELPAGSHVWCYLRHSPGDHQSIDSQLAGMQQWCVEMGWAIDRMFIDEALEGSREDRAEFQLLMSMSRQEPRPIDGIVLWSFSRFARDQLDAQFYKAELRKRGYAVLSKTDDIPNNEMAPIYEAFIDWKNQRFLDDLSADVRRGLGYIVEQGYWPGGRPSVGYRTEPEVIGQRRNGEPRLGQRIVKDNTVADRVTLAWRMKLEGNASLQEILEATHLYSKREHYSEFFSNLLYAGIFVYRGKRFPAAWEDGERFCEPYVTLEEFLRVQARREARTRETISPRRLASPYLLTGLLRCGLCESRGEDVPMNGHQQNPRFPQTRCYRCAQKMHGRGTSCAMPKTPTWVVEEAVCNDLLGRVLTVEYLTASIEAAQEAIATSRDDVEARVCQAEAEMSEQKQRLSRLLAVIEQKGINDLIEQQYDRANERYLALTAQLSSLRASQARLKPKPLQREEIARYVAEMREVLMDGPVQERQALLRQFIRRVVLHLGSVTIEYNFRPELGHPTGSSRHAVGLTNRGLRVGDPWGHQTTDSTSSGKPLYDAASVSQGLSPSLEDYGSR